MGPSVAYEKDCEKRHAEKLRDVKYDAHGADHRYANLEKDTQFEDRCLVKYASGTNCATAADHCAPPRPACAAKPRKSSSTGSGERRSCVTVAPGAAAAAAATTKERRSHSVASSRDVRALHSSHGHAALARQEELCGDKRAPRHQLAPTAVAAECYEVRRPTKKYQPCREVRWQHGKYVRDECGSGVVPVRFDIGPCKRLWCKTPLSMYQATIGELGRQLLCREKRVPRDVWPEPPCNMAEYIMPPCRGYYRRYDCVRPCEEEHAYVRQGRKYYRDRVERYWEPCLIQEHKHTLNVNEYAPQNAALTLKLRRENMGMPCW